MQSHIILVYGKCINGPQVVGPDKGNAKIGLGLTDIN